MKKTGRTIFVCISLCALWLSFCYGYEWVPGIIHVHTKVSDGIFSIEDILRVAARNGIRVVILSDGFSRKVQYSPLPFLRGTINKTIELNSVSRYGADNYLTDICKANGKNTEVIIIEGVEASPFYYWEGSWFNKNLIMKNWNKNILVTGLENADDYKNIPCISNKKSSYRLWRRRASC